MSFAATVLKMFIASPGDTADAREAVVDALHSWNGARGERERVVLLPRRWESDSVPQMGADPQSLINTQLVDDADIVIALFDSRLGRATPRSVSGTAEEIERAAEAGKPVHVWISDEPLPRDVDTEQLLALRAFIADLEPRGLLGRYANPTDLAYQVRNAIDSDIRQLVAEVDSVHSAPPAQRGAVLRARASSTGGTLTVVVRNDGDGTAENLRVISSGPQLDGPEGVDLLSGTDLRWIGAMSIATEPAFNLTMTWQENGDERRQVQHVTV